jgi:putative methionine-R-sulfoxide reductase with GAF domain
MGLTGRRHLTIATAGIERRVWSQPLLLLAAVLVVLPVLIQRTSGVELRLAVGGVAFLGLVSVVSALSGPYVGPRGRSWMGWTQVALSAIGLLTLVHLALPGQPEHGLALAAAVAATVAPVRRTWLRLPVQLLVVGGMALLLVRAGHGPAEVLLWSFLLAFVVWLCGAFSRDLLAVRRRARGARRSAERRAELLAAVRDLSGRSSSEAAATVTTTLRSLGFSVAGVSLLQGDRIVPLVLDGLPPAAGLRVGQGVAGAAVDENRTIVAGDYQRDPRRLNYRKGARSVVAVPIRERGEAVGVVMGGRHTPGAPPEAMVEIVDVLAAHLGGVLETERRVLRQRELLDRMETLEDMRSKMVSEISEHVRDPLTVVRGIAQTLVAHGDVLPVEQRARLLDGFSTQTRALRDTIDALLDFTKFQAAHPVTTLGLVRLGDLLEGLDDRMPLRGDLDAVARTDPVLVGRAIELLCAVQGVERVEVEVVGERVVVRFEGRTDVSSSRTRLLLRLAERLVVAVDGVWATGPSWVELRLPLQSLAVAE